ncbi:MAG: dihydropteroate synthase [Gammaproteobacteria bacterium]|nr:dihydropteroate synthase [Gammaproteobacteria bacterium]
MTDTPSKPLLMGVLNVTPDSFSDGGLHHDLDAAVARAREMVDLGADIVDIGGESTRPGANRVSIEEQLKRVIPVLRQLQQELPAEIPISIDTTSTLVAGAALEQGATIVNDISAGRDDPGMLSLVAEARTPYIIMHMQGTPRTMQDNPRYNEVVAEIKAFLVERALAAQAAGVLRKNLVIDPGIGFGKSKRDNLDIILNLDSFIATGYKVMLGASRKRFMGSICDITSYSELIGATCATTAIGVFAGVHILRVHDIKENRQALDVAWALLERKRGQI